jgi:hypothetical protein
MAWGRPGRHDAVADASCEDSWTGYMLVDLEGKEQKAQSQQWSSLSVSNIPCIRTHKTPSKEALTSLARGCTSFEHVLKHILTDPRGLFIANRESRAVVRGAVDVVVGARGRIVGAQQPVRFLREKKQETCFSGPALLCKVRAFWILP